MLKIQFTPEFKDDYKAAVDRGFNVFQFQEAVTYLINGLSLPDKFNRRPYTDVSSAQDMFTCLIEPNNQIVYRITPTTVILRGIRNNR